MGIQCQLIVPRDHLIRKQRTYNGDHEEDEEVGKKGINVIMNVTKERRLIASKQNVLSTISSGGFVEHQTYENQSVAQRRSKEAWHVPLRRPSRKEFYPLHAPSHDSIWSYQT